MMIRMLMRMAFRAMRHHAVRSCLTLLGIFIGIAGIIVIAALGRGAQQKARNQFLAYGAKNIELESGNWMVSLKKPGKKLSLGDMKIIMSQCPEVQYISPKMYLSQIPVEYAGTKSTAQVVGAGENVLRITDEHMSQGSFFTDLHVQRKENVAVLSLELAELFFKNKNPVGEFLRVDKAPYMIIGVLAPPKLKGRWDGLGRPKLLIPYSTHQFYFGNAVHQIAMSTYTEADVPKVVRQLEKIFRAAHYVEAGEPNDFMIYDYQTFAVAAEKAAQSVGIFALLAAIIALLVGGIGVMNIMLVAVQERTREIGVKMALGATASMIRQQFLIEAVVICVTGGAIGVALGVGASLVFNYWVGMAAIVDIGTVIVSFLSTVIIGLIFGLYPAERAAKLKPVMALSEY